jgi:hypothetical protein
MRTCIFPSHFDVRRAGYNTSMDEPVDDQQPEEPTDPEASPEHSEPLVGGLSFLSEQVRASDALGAVPSILGSVAHAAAKIDKAWGHARILKSLEQSAPMKINIPALADLTKIKFNQSTASGFADLVKSQGTIGTIARIGTARQHQIQALTGMHQTLQAAASIGLGTAVGEGLLARMGRRQLPEVDLLGGMVKALASSGANAALAELAKVGGSFGFAGVLASMKNAMPPIRCENLLPDLPPQIRLQDPMADGLVSAAGTVSWNDSEQSDTVATANRVEHLMARVASDLSAWRRDAARGRIEDRRTATSRHRQNMALQIALTLFTILFMLILQQCSHDVAVERYRNPATAPSTVHPSSHVPTLEDSLRRLPPRNGFLLRLRP